MQFGLFGLLLKKLPVILELTKASKFSATRNPARNQRRGKNHKRVPLVTDTTVRGKCLALHQLL